MRPEILNFGSIQEIGSEDTVDDPLGVLLDLTFPHHDDVPPVGLQQPDVAPVPLHVPRELCLPELTVVLGHGEVADGTAMPEASVDEDRNLPSRITDIGSSRDLPLETVSWIPCLTQ